MEKTTIELVGIEETQQEMAKTLRKLADMLDARTLYVTHYHGMHMEAMQVTDDGMFPRVKGLREMELTIKFEVPRWANIPVEIVQEGQFEEWNAAAD